MFRATTTQPQATQKNLMLLEKLYPGSINNHRSVAVEIHGPIQLDAFKKALLIATERHEMLRAVVSNSPSQLCFEINREPRLPFDYFDASAYLKVPHITELIETLNLLNKKAFITTPFNLLEGPLWRCALIQFKPDVYQFVMLFNHIIVDEASIGVIFRDVSAIYNSLITQGKVPELDSIPSLTDLNFDLPQDETDKRLTYWRKRLEDFNPLTLQTDYPSQNAFKFTGRRMSFTLDNDLIYPLMHNPELKGASLNQILLANLYALLYRYSGENDLCLGVTSSNRRFNGIEEKTVEKLVNCFFNSIPVRVAFEKTTVFTDLVYQVKTALSDGLKNQLPPDLILDEALSKETRSALRTATLFNILLVLNRKKPTLTLSGTTASYPVELDLGRCKFPYFGINLDELDDGAYQGFLEYNTDLFSEETMSRLLEHFKKSLRYIATHPKCEIGTIPLILDEEKALIHQLNNTEKPQTIRALLPDFFHQQALEAPDKVALVFHPENGPPERITYRELDERTSQLANYMRLRGVIPGENVGVSVTRSSNLVVAMLAALKAGATLVPMETEASTTLNHKLESNRFAMIVVDQATTHLFNAQAQVLLNLESPKTKYAILCESKSYAPPAITADSPAYVMYTSGTSGDKPTPKSIVVAHRSLNNLLNAISDESLTPHTRVICTALHTFDAFLYDMAAAATTKGELHLTFANGRYSPEVLTRIIKNEKIQFGVFLPQLLSTLNPQLPLEYVICMGAVPDEEVMQVWASAVPGRRLFDDLGHTETGVWLTKQRYQPGIDHTLVGQPIRNMQIFILNPDDLSLCPIGVEGEIYVAGPGLAIGYLNNPQLTNEKFPLVTYDPETGNFVRQRMHTPNTIRLYATGDLACYKPLPSGELSIKFIGRKDREIKLNGVRVDLDEVESVLKAHKLVKNVTVVPNKDYTALIAYIVPHDIAVAPEALWSNIKTYLSTTLLPSVAYPSTYFAIPEMPLTPNGKINLRALPQQLEPTIVVTAPLTPLQTKIRRIWSRILRIPEESLGLTLSFRQLGGNSLQLAKLEIALNAERANLGISFPEYIGVNVLSNHMTIASLAESLTPNPKIDLGLGAVQRGGTLFFRPRNPTPNHTRPTQAPPNTHGGPNTNGSESSTAYQPQKLQ